MLATTLALSAHISQSVPPRDPSSGYPALSSKLKLDCSIVIIGGGISGLWSADELARSGHGAVCMFERESRVGGRVFDISYASYGGDIEPAGMGAWRIAPNHYATWWESCVLKKLMFCFTW